MSYKISYLVPKKEFERLIGQKQPRAVSVKAQEAPAKKLPAPRRHAKPKTMTSEKRERMRKAKSSDREKTWVKQSGVRKKCRVHNDE